MPDASHWHGYKSFVDYLKANMALLPLLAIVGAAALSVADSRYMVRDEDGEQLGDQIEVVQEAVTEIRAEQRVSKSEVEHIKESVGEVKQSTKEINEKLDRLIERR